MGRLDTQVKLRGFRLELGEIEAVLSQHQEIHAAVAMLRENKKGQPQLVAYVVPEQEMPQVEALRAYVQSYLPEYMVPSAFMPLNAFPLTPNGKIDRKKLPEPESVEVTRREIEPPTTAFEKTLAAIWSDVLGQERIGIHDNFFALGGDSIQVVQVCTRAQQAHLHLVPGQLFRYQTIAALSRLHTQSQQDAESLSAAVAHELKSDEAAEGTSLAGDNGSRSAVSLPVSLTPNKLNKIMAQIQKGKKKS
ncbi:hypothetical protein KDH_23900 [Dictyobacter sp. S3.2.2.5]|uniref:Carrier domain-containing protein n=1 Tax=Dictyobacter halimunensis TaxID=3026934 RepID=A0ABQ6FMS2_9CHLR|nr:hypothetical protein KDH_23900 [Dictyobacter sp. S3.2.2.5]